MRRVFCPMELRRIRRLTCARAGDNYPVSEEKFRLFDFIQNVQISRDSVGTMLLLNVSKDFDMLASKFLSLPEQLSRAAFDDSRAAYVGVDIALHTQKIQIGIICYIQCRFVCRLQHLNPNWSRKSF